MDPLLIFALISNLLIIFLECFTLSKLKKKIDTFKFYTYLQNFLALIVSVLFVIFLTIYMISKNEFLEVIKGLRYIVTSGLVATTFIYVIFLAKNNKITDEDFKSSISPKLANIILHYVCPLLSLLSFLVFERNLALTTPIYTMLVAIPSCAYWIVYALLSTFKVWKEPYNLSLSKNRNMFLEVLVMILIPISFILISFILWNIK